MGFLFIQRLRLRLRQRLRRVSCTSAARQHGRRRSSRLEKILIDFQESRETINILPEIKFSQWSWVTVEGVSYHSEKLSHPP